IWRQSLRGAGFRNLSLRYPPLLDTTLLSTFYAIGNFYNQCKNNVPQ
ncbi:hypothetical protein HH610_003153, partial [Escherichia coli]|nr:hypothetical protein [Escherichia coli]EFI3847894.1 hypothetical protein [Escherichia coli]EFJ0492876.1 hypothetical protein [Escherichia coli]